jgi:FkbM family methyltransferase
LRCFPIVKRLPGGVLYRQRWIESIPLSKQMLESGEMYPADKLPGGVVTCVDLGCNVGYFPCWLARLSGGGRVKGLMIDANPKVVEEARWHARVNHWDQVFALCGIAGGSAGKAEGDFYLYPSNHCSADSPNPSLKDGWKRIRVPCLDVGQLWRDKFGETRCQLLKIDIEGAELDFLKAEHHFLALVDALLIEWHKWRVQLPDVAELLKAHGFPVAEVVEEHAEQGTCLFRRQEAVVRRSPNPIGVACL